MMRLHFLILGLLLGACLTAQGQIKCKLEIEHNLYLRYQPISVDLTVVNLTPRPLNLREVGLGGNAQFEFVLRDSKNKRVVRREKQPLGPKLFIVHPQETETKAFGLYQAFKLTRPGIYNLTVEFVFAERRFESESVNFEIREGVEVDSLEIFEPARVFKLLRADRKIGQFIFLGIYSPKEDLSYGTYELGRIVQGKESQIRLDGDNNIHILHPGAPDRYVHSIFTTSGTPVNQVLHQSEFGGAELRILTSGEARVLGTKPIP